MKSRFIACAGILRENVCDLQKIPARCLRILKKSVFVIYGLPKNRDRAAEDFGKTMGRDLWISKNPRLSC